jgi:hypothetical protein
MSAMTSSPRPPDEQPDIGPETAPTARPDATLDSPAAGSAARRWTAVVRRWPTWLALGMTVATLGGSDVAEVVEGYGEALLILPLLYLLVAKLERRDASWPVLVAGFASIAILRLTGVVAPSVVFVGVAVVVLVWSVLGDEGGEPGLLRLQALGMVGFGALAVGGLAVDVDLGVYLVAAGWFLHGIWDFVHLRLDKVVARSYAEWCGVIDVLVAVQLLALA